MLFNFAWLYNFALKDYINISQQEVFGILFPDLYVRDRCTDKLKKTSFLETCNMR